MEQVRYLLTALVLGLLYPARQCNGDLSEDLHYYETLKMSNVGTRVKRSADPNPAQHMREIWFSALGKTFHMYLKQTAVFSKDYQAHVFHQDGTKTPFKVDETKLLQGKLKGDDNSSVSVHWDGDVMTASITTDEDIFVVEPSWRHLPPSDNHTMIAYRKSDSTLNIDSFVGGVPTSFCGVGDKVHSHLERVGDDQNVIRLFPPSQSRHRQKRRASPYVGTHKACRMAIVADYLFFKNIGRNDKHQTSEYIAHLIGKVSQTYTRTVWPGAQGDIKGLSLEIAELIIHDSYTDTSPGDVHYNMVDRSNDMSLVLDMFGQSHYKDFKKFCLGHLLTYQSFPGKLGLAYIASWRSGDLGGICSPVWSGGQQAVNTGVSSFKNPGGSTAMTLQASLTVTHGHNFGSEHDPDTAACSPSKSDGGKYIMHPRVISGYETNNQIFSPCSRRYIGKVVQYKGYDCFTEETGGGVHKCGNGRIDKGEECDAGYRGDSCCNNECKLIGTAVCSHMNYPCCSDCKPSPADKKCISSVEDFDCKQPSTCNGKDLECPTQKNKPNNTRCFDNGKCVNGVCQDLCMQQGRKSCICEGDIHGCHVCCMSETGKCEVLLKEAKPILLQDGLPCYKGFCEKGKCEESQDVIKRLFNILDILDIDKLAVFLKNNVVWVVLVLATPLWIICMVLTERYDRSKEEKEVKTRQNMTIRRNRTVLPGHEMSVGPRIVWERRGGGVPHLNLPVYNNM